LLTVLNLSFTDVIAMVLTPAAVASLGWIKYLEATKDKHKLTIEADAEKERKRIEADVEKEKVRVQGEVDKAREKSLGGEAVLKIWKEIEDINKELKKLTDAQHNDHSNDLLVNEIIRRLQDDVSKLMRVLFDTFINK
jgi:hypothetical protein